MKTTVKEITPQWASKILETRNPVNRNLSESVAKSFANEMKSGRWALTHQGIAFNANGDLIDGQHRLRAVVIAGRPVEMLVTTGIPSTQKNGITYSTMDVVDTGRVRSIGQQLNLAHGWTCGGAAAAMARGIAVFYCPGHKNQSLRVTTPQVLAIINAFEKSFRAVLGEGMRVPQRHNSKLAASVAIYHTYNPERAIEFWKSYLDQVGWTSESPARALDRWRQNFPRDINSSRGLGQCAAAAALLSVEEETPCKIVRVNEPATKWLANLNPNLRNSVRKIMGL